MKSQQRRQVPDPGDEGDLTRDSVSSAALNASQSLWGQKLWGFFICFK